MTTTVESVDLLCSFCGKPDRDIARMIAGPGVYICNECVDLCNAILADAPTTAANSGMEAELPYWQEFSDDRMLAQLPRIARVAAQVETSLLVWVGRLRQRGVAWTRIGAALSMTRQSAWERFSGED